MATYPLTTFSPGLDNKMMLSSERIPESCQSNCRGISFVFAVVRLFWPADSLSAYRLCWRCQAAWIKQWCGELCCAPSDLTHRVNLNRFGTGSGAVSLVMQADGFHSHLLLLLIKALSLCTSCSRFDWSAFTGTD